MAKTRTLDDLIKRLSGFEQDLQKQAPSFILKAGRSFLEQKKEQILSFGVGRYSKKKYHPSSLKKKVISGAGLSFLETKIQKKEKTNWSELRQAEGLQASFVDLWYTGQMWNSTVAQKKNQISFTYFVTIGARNKKAQEKLFANFKRYGDFLRPNEQQAESLRQNLKTSITNLLIRKIK